MKGTHHLQSPSENTTQHIAEPETAFKGFFRQFDKLRQRILVKCEREARTGRV